MKAKITIEKIEESIAFIFGTVFYITFWLLIPATIYFAIFVLLETGAIQ